MAKRFWYQLQTVVYFALFMVAYVIDREETEF